MPAQLQPIRRYKCTFKGCSMSFETEKGLRSHKKYSDEHEYCDKCDEDFDCYDDYVQHKITRPKEHDKACRVCGDEFKSDSGLRRHIELNHKIDQKLTCIGCQKSFYRACLFIEHLEFGHCEVISTSQFQGHVVHKHLIVEFLKKGTAYERFQQKIEKFEATQDYEDEGGVDIQDPLGGDEEIDDVQFEALKPDPTNAPDAQASSYVGPYPPLPSKPSRTSNVSEYEVASTLDGLSLNGGSSVAGESDTSTVVGSPVTGTFPVSSTDSIHGSSASSSSNRQPKPWGGRKTARTLFPDAKPNPVAPLSEFSIAAHDAAMEKGHGVNIMRTRFWDPMSSDWNPEKFFDSVMSKYACPFICEQAFECVGDLNDHILGDHRITRMKCPTCLKYFKSATALISHCESHGAKCQISKAEDFNIFLDRISGGFLAVDEKTRPDHLNNPKVFINNDATGRMEVYTPPVATYLQYRVTTPPDWREPPKLAAQIGGPPQQNRSVW